MNIIFIDTNIYLRFYDGNRKDLKKLLDILLKVSDNIFITNQIISEIERNKLPIFKKSISNYTNNLKVNKILLPEHFITDIRCSEIKDWNKRRDSICKDNEELTKEIDKIFIKNLELISKSQDSVSLKIKDLYKNAQKATEEELINARLRKEFGNPPGKESDSLGDQINWEQFLNIAINYNEVWFITNDTDYVMEYKKSFFLNSFLYSELITKNSNIKINCYNDLLEGLVAYGKKNNIKDFIDKKVVDEIRQEEKQYRIVVESSNIESIGYDAKGKILEIEFLNGSIYQYFDVPEHIYSELMSADSHGKYLNANIKGSYRYSKV